MNKFKKYCPNVWVAETMSDAQHERLLMMSPIGGRYRSRRKENDYEAYLHAERRRKRIR